jgi:peptidoglycan DL-endopeptidase CwlO
MHRAKHRAAGRASAEVHATTLIERFAFVPGARQESDAPRHGVATLPAHETAVPEAGPEPVSGPDLFGPAPCTSPMLAVRTDDEAAPRRTCDAADLFGGDPYDGVPQPGDSPLFGAARHARRSGPTPPVIPGPRVPALPFPTPSLSGMRPQPVGAALSVTVLGAAAAVTAVVAPAPSLVETTGSMAPVQSPAPAPVRPVGPVLAPAPAPALPDRPEVKVDELVTKALDYTPVASATDLSSPAAVRKAALTNALGKIGKPYRWGAMGPNAFDCSGLVKWSFANAGKNLPRTSRAMASMGTPVSRANLQPGDLVFFYQPISHVGIYIGGGKIVHASRSGQPVKISDMSRMRFTTARRI